MSNPLLNNQMTNNNPIYNIKNIMQDPNTIIRNNPQLQTILAMYNGDAKTAFYSLCKQKGVNPETILNQLR